MAKIKKTNIDRAHKYYEENQEKHKNKVGRPT